MGTTYRSMCCDHGCDRHQNIVRQNVLIRGKVWYDTLKSWYDIWNNMLYDLIALVSWLESLDFEDLWWFIKNDTLSHKKKRAVCKHFSSGQLWIVQSSQQQLVWSTQISVASWDFIFFYITHCRVDVSQQASHAQHAIPTLANIKYLNKWMQILALWLVWSGQTPWLHSFSFKCQRTFWSTHWCCPGSWRLGTIHMSKKTPNWSPLRSRLLLGTWLRDQQPVTKKKHNISRMHPAKSKFERQHWYRYMLQYAAKKKTNCKKNSLLWSMDTETCCLRSKPQTHSLPNLATGCC